MKYYWNYLEQGYRVARNNVLLVMIYSVIFLTYSVLGPGMSWMRFVSSIILLGFVFTPFMVLAENINGNKTTPALIGKSYKNSFFKAIKMVSVVAFFYFGWVFLKKINFDDLTKPKISWAAVIASPWFFWYAIFYSVEKLAFGKSVMKAVIFAVKEWSFTITMCLYSLVSQVISYYLLVNNYQKSIFYLLFQITSVSINLILTAALVLYFKEKKWREQ